MKKDPYNTAVTNVLIMPVLEAKKASERQ